jgi:hypothetical protein
MGSNGMNNKKLLPRSGSMMVDEKQDISEPRSGSMMVDEKQDINEPRSGDSMVAVK